jgi:hypothetical protein
VAVNRAMLPGEIFLVLLASFGGEQSHSESTRENLRRRKVEDGHNFATMNGHRKAGRP